MAELNEYQQRVLEALGGGLTNAEITSRVGGTGIHNEIKRICALLELKTRIQAVIYFNQEEVDLETDEAAAAAVRIAGLPPNAKQVLAEITRLCQVRQVNDLGDLMGEVQQRCVELRSISPEPALLPLLQGAAKPGELAKRLLAIAAVLGVSTKDPEVAWYRSVRLYALASSYAVMHLPDSYQSEEDG